MREIITNNTYTIKDAGMAALTGFSSFNLAEALNRQNGGEAALWALMTIGAAANIFFDSVEHDILSAQKRTANLLQLSEINKK